ncbi:MaoC family dehydratase N-terminal domain-containing protein [Chloroflexota bacterium]
MTKGSVITDEVRNAIGMEFGPYVYEVEKGAIMRVAEAVGDPNPLWQDEEYAEKSRYGGIIASPTFLFSLRFDEVTRLITELECPLKNELNGGSEIEYFQPIRPGDVITVRAKLSDVHEREGRSGKLLFFPIDLTYENQRGELVARHRFNFIRY